MQEAAETYFHDGAPVPSPSALEELTRNPAYSGGVWLLAVISTRRLCIKTVRLNISLPESVVQTLHDYGRDEHMSRSAFLAKAALNEMRVNA